MAPSLMMVLSSSTRWNFLPFTLMVPDCFTSSPSCLLCKRLVKAAWKEV